jgi:formamidopyrimidine-DNA glycosylase
MPELPEVETTRRGIEPYLIGRTVAAVNIRERRLRWPVNPRLAGKFKGQRVREVGRRGKYLLMHTDEGCLIIHLGMSGSLRLADPASPPRKHDHVDIVTDDGHCLRYHDPRRFGALLWTTQPYRHALLKALGPEPWDLSAAYLHDRARGRSQSIKSFIMDSRTLVGVGNIYASESLFEAGVDPRRQAGRISLTRFERLRAAIVSVLEQAIGCGGTTLRDFVNAEGNPGYFRQVLRVYEREGQPCRSCLRPIRHGVILGRATYYCRHCQH